MSRWLVRLVEDQQRRRVMGDKRQVEPRSFAARQRLDRNERLVLAEAEAAKPGADRLRALQFGQQRGEMARRQQVGRPHFLDLMLGEKPGDQL